MREMIALADKHTVVIRLHVHPCGDDPMPVKKLAKWYESLGFVKDSGMDYVYFPINHPFRVQDRKLAQIEKGLPA